MLLRSAAHAPGVIEQTHALLALIAKRFGHQSFDAESRNAISVHESPYDSKEYNMLYVTQPPVVSLGCRPSINGVALFAYRSFEANP